MSEIHNTTGLYFRLEALCDFIDDAFASSTPITSEHIDDMMRQFRQLGITRVSWAYYADERGGHILPYDHNSDDDFIRKAANAQDNYRQLGNPLKRAVEAGHKHGIEVFAYFKPYEMGGGLWYPDGAPEAQQHGRIQKVGGRQAWFDPFVLKNPELRIKRRTDDIPPDNANVPISSITLRKADDSPTRIKREHLQIWVSEDNYLYEQLDVAFDLSESIEIAKHDVSNLSRDVLTRKGDKIRIITISGLNLTQPYILVTTDYAEGDGDFVNTAVDMMRVYDKNGRELIGVYSNGSAIYNAHRVDFRNWGVMFDHGYGCKTSALDNSNTNGNDGFVAFARGRSEYLDGALCETEPGVQEFWLDCVKAMLDAGVDGVDFRIENHSTHTDFPGDYGYNQVVLDNLSDPSHPDIEEIARVRGDAYTGFLRKSKELLASNGKQMRTNFQMDVLRPVAPRNRQLAYPANMEFQWERWIDEGLLDEAIFRFYALGFEEVLHEEIGQRVIQRCQEHGLPIIFNRYVNQGDAVEEFKQIQKDDRFGGFILYEVYDFVSYEADGTATISRDSIREISRLFKGVK